MKSKLLVLAVLSAMSLGAQADDPEYVSLGELVPGLTTLDGSINVVNFSQNVAPIDASVTIDAGNDIAFTQQDSVSLDVSGLGDGVGIDVTAEASTYDTATLNTQLSFKAENLGNKIDTSAIGAVVVAETIINTGSNSESLSFKLEGEYANYESKYDYQKLELEELSFSTAYNGLPTTNVVNVAYNQADINASVGLHAGNEAEFQNLQISTNAIGSYALTTTTLAIGVAAAPSAP
ncbi:hypothetical protein MCERHM32_00637 [Methylophilaceae bacterium]